MREARRRERRRERRRGCRRASSTARKEFFGGPSIPGERARARTEPSHVTIEVWLPTVAHLLGLEHRRIGRGFSLRDYAPSKFGCPMCGRPSSLRRLTGRARWLRFLRWRKTTKTSSTRTRLTRGEERRGLDRAVVVVLRLAG